MRYLFFYLYILLKILSIIFFTDLLHEFLSKEYFRTYLSLDYDEKNNKCRLKYYNMFTKKNINLDI